MATASLGCTNCGSADVKEVKPETYFCNACDSIFKYIDPTKLTVSPDFCGCGDPIQVQCNVCHVGLCRNCDILCDIRLRQRWPAGVFGDQSLQLISTSEVGYSLDHVQGLFFPLSKVISTVRNHHSDLHHLCMACVERAVPETADRIANRIVCESPACSEPASGPCRCCSDDFCKSCLTHKWGGRLVNRNIPESLDIYCDDICRGCSDEVKDALSGLIGELYSDELEPKGGGEFLCGRAWRPVDAKTERGRKKQQAQNRAISEEWRAQAQTLSDSLTIALTNHLSASTCTRGRSQLENSAEFSKRLECEYSFVDHRVT